MARPIRARPEAPTGPEIVATRTLATDLAATDESVRELLELVRLLDERGLLRFASDLLREEDRVVAVLSDRVPPDGVRRAMRNLEVLVKTFRDIDPKTLDALARGVPGALEAARRAQGDEPLGILAILRVLRDPEVNRGVRMVLGFLRGIGADSRE
jgi:uncharacterized protein YjgD (DUF1641 family)